MIRFKTQNIISLSLLLVLLFFLSITFIAYQINNKKKKLFIQSNQKQIEKSVNIANSLESKRLHQVTFDYTFWDDMVNFVQNKNINWAPLNIDPILSTYNIDALWIFDTTKTKIYCISQETYPLLKDYNFENIIFDSLRNARFINYYAKTPDGILEVFGATIHPSSDPKRLTNPKGFFLIGRFLSDDFLVNLSTITSTKISILNDTLQTSNEEANHIVHINIPLSTLSGDVINHLHVEKHLDFLQQYEKSSTEFISLYTISALVIFILLLIVTSRWINRPLRIVEEVLETEDPFKANELKKFGLEFVKIGQLMTSYISQKKTLEILKKKAEESDRLKSAFMANMSHEIRTPLNGILGFTELICSSLPADETLKSYKKIVKNCSNDLLKLINDILDFSKIESGQLKIEKEIFTVEEVIKDLSGIYGIRKSLLLQKGVELNFHTSDYNIELNTDKRRLRQILVHIVDNAIKFTEKGSIEIGVTINEERVKIFVKDTGIGVSKEVQEVVFKRFWQAAQPNSKVYGGTGLGLALCKGLANLMDGDIGVESEEGKGSNFYIELPFTTKNKITSEVTI